MHKFKIKVCGMRETSNISDLAELMPDFMGFIFYEKSKRFVTNDLILSEINPNIKKVGVFVNQGIDEILTKVNTYYLDFVQLHGNESPELCEELKSKNIGVIKVFLIDADFDFNETKKYENFVDYFLFDTKGDGYGGHGTTFDWSLLKKYNQKVGFLLAGGISTENIQELLELEDLNIIGIDVNSKFEIKPALKDIEKLKELFEKIKI